MKTSIVIGLGYGDEGKGLSTDYLCRQSNNPIVIRFSGGHQAGHTVVNEEKLRHVFSNFGAGTLQNAPTYWSSFCTFNPLAYFNELQALKKLGIVPVLYLDALAPVTTPYDIFFNRIREKKVQHGSCGVGFGATISRQKTPYKLYAQDLKYPIVLQQKLAAIERFYMDKTDNKAAVQELKEQAHLFIHLADELAPSLNIVNEHSFARFLSNFDHLVFEGSQGILLDMDHGFFPNVTHANTTSKNAIALIHRNPCLSILKPEVYYVTRAYQTRHGNGFLSNEVLEVNYEPNPNETNQYNEWQGTQRTSPLDIDMLNYALDCDKNYAAQYRKHLIVTCMDQLAGPLSATINGKIKTFPSSLMLQSEIDTRFNSILESYSDCAANMVLRKQVLAA